MINWYLIGHNWRLHATFKLIKLSRSWDMLLQLEQACFLHTFPAICATGVAGNLSFWKFCPEFWKNLTWVFFFFVWVFWKCAKKHALILAGAANDPCKWQFMSLNRVFLCSNLMLTREKKYWCCRKSDFLKN